LESLYAAMCPKDLYKSDSIGHLTPMEQGIIKEDQNVR